MLNDLKLKITEKLDRSKSRLVLLSIETDQKICLYCFAYTIYVIHFIKWYKYDINIFIQIKVTFFTN